MSSSSFSFVSPSSFLISLPAPRLPPPFHPKVDSLSSFDPSSARIRIGRRRRKGIFLKAREEEQEDVFAMGPRFMDVEAEIYEFMRKSDKPMDFPTRRELVAAGRADLAEAVAAQGGWLAMGWDLDGDEVIDVGTESRSGVGQEDGRICQERVSCGSLMSDAVGTLAAEDNTAAPSSSGRSLETENVEDDGIDGILSRLEKERGLSFAMGSREKAVYDKDSWRDAVHDPGDTTLVSHKLALCSNDRNSRSESVESENIFLHHSGGVYSQNGASKDVNITKSSTPDMWRSWSLKRAGFSIKEFEAAEIVPTDDRKTLEADPLDAEYRSVHKQTRNSFNSDNGINEPAADKSQIQLRLQHLEADLSSALQLARSRSGAVSQKHQKNSTDELHSLCDAWEFQETEIMNAQNKLRSIRAKLAVLEGKISFEIMEARKRTEEKQNRIDSAQNALLLLHTTNIVWPNSASEVLLAGSFDGWTGQRRMERSSSGVFSLQLKLYPGRYEIKFIVDGVWKVDPLRPIVRNSGHENNLLIVK
ncbi:protein FLOURY ENDOSPERM 6, chloroplastic-like [Musa acuminata AAA Group]|uniref:protein FLOURY ENDOSPERM 6, chloroplastic-like n=1 Tax=Musa acuminata AAA Group TaxID=214697 RepID=UPI0031D370D6